MTDKAHFHFNSFVNKQNFRYWGVENPKKFDEKEFHPQRVTVWSAIMCNRIIGPYFFENAEDFTESQMRKISTHAQYILRTCCYSSAQSPGAVVSTG